MEVNLNDFLDWQREKSSRLVRIEIGDAGDPKKLRIWCYDFKLEIGQRVWNVSDIDLEAEKEKVERERYEVLKRKFEGGGSDAQR